MARPCWMFTRDTADEDEAVRSLGLDYVNGRTIKGVVAEARQSPHFSVKAVEKMWRLAISQHMIGDF